MFRKHRFWLHLPYLFYDFFRSQAQYRRILSCRCTADSPQVNQQARGPLAVAGSGAQQRSNPQRAGTAIVRGSVTQLNAHAHSTHAHSAHAHSTHAHNVHARSRSCHQNNGGSGTAMLLRDLKQPRGEARNSLNINNGQLTVNSGETEPFLRYFWPLASRTSSWDFLFGL